MIFTILAITYERKQSKTWLESLLIFEEMRVTAVIVVEKMASSLFFYLSTVVLENFSVTFRAGCLQKVWIEKRLCDN